MMKSKVVLACGLVWAATRLWAAGPHWGYSGAEGPEKWGTLDPANSACSAGKNQSPIDLSTFTEGNLKPISFSYDAVGREIVNNGHTLQVNYPVGSTIAVDGHPFALKQFHVHAPCENHVQGKSFPLEAHFVHADAAGQLAVVAVFFNEGAANPELDKAWGPVPPKAGEKRALATPVSAEALMPADRAYYRYRGSLTTPPCSEGVMWLVLKTPVTASKEQIEQVRHALHHANNRPIQPLNGRVVEK